MSHVPEQEGDAGQESSGQSTTEEKPDVTKSASLPHAKHMPEDTGAPSPAGTPEHTGIEHSPPQGEHGAGLAHPLIHPSLMLPASCYLRC